VKTRGRAQALLEFAIVVPLFLLLLFALLDFSRLIFTYVSLSNGAREMARVASVSNGWSSAAAVNAFTNYTIVAGGQNGSTDKVSVIVGDSNCARTRDTGGTCSPTPTVCTLPLSTASCTLPKPKQGGFIEVQVTYTFQFNPLFQTRVDGVIDVSFMRPTALVTTTSRAYVE
jgi:Flp pilus assembly protein TadG